MARKPNLPDEATTDAIVGLIARGSYPTRAAEALGIPSSTFSRWMDKGAQAVPLDLDPAEHTKSELIAIATNAGLTVPASWTKARITEAIADTPASPYREFWERIKRAEPLAEAYYVNQVHEAAATTPTAAMMFLERRWPDRWSRQESRRLTITTEPADEDPAELLEAGDRRLRLLQGGADG